MAIDERDRVELGLLMDEYRSLKTEIVSNLTSARQIASIAFAGVGALVAAGRFLAESGRTDLLLVVPVFFYALAWAQLRYVFMVLDLGNYIRKVIAPRVRELVGRIPSDQSDELSRILSWEDKGKSVVLKRTTVDPLSQDGKDKGMIRKLVKIVDRLSFIPIAGANFGIPLLAAAASVVAYFVIRPPSGGLPASEKALVVLNVLAFLYSAYWGWRAETAR